VWIARGTLGVEIDGEASEGGKGEIGEWGKRVDVSQTCRSAHCSGEQLDRWCRLMSGLSPLRRGQERRVPTKAEEPGMSMRHDQSKGDAKPRYLRENHCDSSSIQSQ